MSGRIYRPQPDPDPVIIPMEEQHVETAARLWKTRFGATPDNMKAWFRDVLAEGKPTEGFVASDGGNVLGFGIATICGPDYVEDYIGHPDVGFEGWEKTGLLHIIAVDEDHEGRGLGSELVEARLRWLTAEGVDGIFGVSWHRDDHRDSRELFEKYGFEPVATVESYYAEMDNPETECVDCDGVCECDATIYAQEVGADD
jgi:GNAT superfamily N-acetyltransferase